MELGSSFEEYSDPGHDQRLLNRIVVDVILNQVVQRF